jgi:hypothetical protein
VIGDTGIPTFTWHLASGIWKTDSYLRHHHSFRHSSWHIWPGRRTASHPILQDFPHHTCSPTLIEMKVSSLLSNFTLLFLLSTSTAAKPPLTPTPTPKPHPSLNRRARDPRLGSNFSTIPIWRTLGGTNVVNIGLGGDGPGFSTQPMDLTLCEWEWGREVQLGAWEVADVCITMGIDVI